MKKELFISSIEAIKEQCKRDRKTSKYFGKAFPNAFEANLYPSNELLINAIIALLSEDESDKDMIEWWIWEADFGKHFNSVWDDEDKKHPVNNAEELYEFLMACKKKTLTASLVSIMDDIQMEWAKSQLK